MQPSTGVDCRKISVPVRAHPSTMATITPAISSRVPAVVTAVSGDRPASRSGEPDDGERRGQRGHEMTLGYSRAA